VAERPIHESEFTPEEIAKVPPGFHVVMRIVPEDDQWTALEMNFDIAGRGDSPEEAIHDTIALLEEYLSYGFAEGRTFEQMLRPVPKRLWLRQIGSLARKALRSRRPSRAGRGGASFHDEPFPIERPLIHAG